ncbi:MAG TPA: hypothetical protein VIE16_11015 [Phenylobacterium sp.]|jgi:hypothetical protein
MRRIGTVAAAVGLGLVAGTARAQALDNADARCVAAMSFAVGVITDEKVKVAASLADFYFIGKLDGRATAGDLEARMRAEAAAMTPASLKAEIDRCTAEFTKRSGEISLIGEHLKTKPVGGP